MILTVLGNVLAESTTSLKEVAECTVTLTGTSKATVAHIRKEGADEEKIMTSGKNNFELQVPKQE